ncbi:hypothetical protein V6N13_061809 [Hibiscus sabdariffa]
MYIISKRSQVVFLCETRLNKRKAESIKNRLNMEGCITVESGQGSTGLMLLWKEEVSINLIAYSNIRIDVEVTTSIKSFRFTGVHAFSGHRTIKTWNLLDRIKSASRLPWLVGGDFDQILSQSEKIGGRRRGIREMEEFKEALERNGLSDLKPDKGWITRYNKEEGNPIRERLDRFTGNIEWINKFSDFRIVSDYSSHSDYHHLLIDTCGGA